MMTISVFTVFAAGFGDPSVYDNVELVWFTVPLMSGVGMYFLTASWTPGLLGLIVAFLAEGFYAYRIFVLAQSYWVPALVVFVSIPVKYIRVSSRLRFRHCFFQLAVVQLVGAIASSVVVKQAHLFSHLLGRKFFITEGVGANREIAPFDYLLIYILLYDY
jgi:hypothetical protein